MQQLRSTPLYYGKSPAWGDFLKTKGQASVIQGIDQWINAALELAMQHPNFDEKYNALPALDIFIGNPQETLFLVANLIASIDRSGRKFPMLLCHLLEVHLPLDHLRTAPFIYKQTLIDLYKKNRAIRGTQNAEQLQRELAKLLPDIQVYSTTDCSAFFEQQTMHSFAQLMKISVEQLARYMMRLGLLLQPLQIQNRFNLDQAVRIPINNQSYCYEISAFWVSLMTNFLAKLNIEVFIAILHAESPVLIFGAQGADIQVLSDIFIQEMQSAHWFSLLESSSFDHRIERSQKLLELEQALCGNHLSLNQGIDLFQQRFRVSVI